MCSNDHMVVVVAAVQAGHEEYRAAQNGCCAHRTRGQVRWFAQQGHRLRRFASQSAVAEDADEGAAFEPVGDEEHGVDSAERDGIGQVPRIDGRQGAR